MAIGFYGPLAGLEFNEGLVEPPPPPGADFELIFATPLNSNTIRAWFTVEPQHRSVIGANDALNRLLWTPSVLIGTAIAPIVEVIENVHANELPLYPDAWSVDIRVDRRLDVRSTYRIVVASNIVSALGVMLSPGFDRGEFPGIINIEPRIRPVATVVTRGVDLRYDFFEGRYILDDRRDIDVHGGIVALKKRIIRRLVTAPGEISALPDYGCGLQSKKLINTTNINDVRARIEQQIRKEEEVTGLNLQLSVFAGVLVVALKIRVRSAGVVPLRVEIPEDGPIRVAA